MKFTWPTVGIINPAFQSTNGRLFGGTTPVLSFGNGTSAWVRIFNPHNSKINLFLSSTLLIFLTILI